VGGAGPPQKFLEYFRVLRLRRKRRKEKGINGTKGDGRNGHCIADDGAVVTYTAAVGAVTQSSLQVEQLQEVESGTNET
jgi:hypothetical protein